LARIHDHRSLVDRRRLLAMLGLGIFYGDFLKIAKVV